MGPDEPQRSSEPGRPGIRLLIAAGILAAGAFLVWGFFAGRDEAAVEAEREQPVTAPLRVSSKNGAAVITIDAATQRRSGIDTQKLAATPYREQVRAYGTVLDVARLTALSNNYATAKAQLETAQAKLAMSKPAFDRAATLYKDRKVVSEAQMQSAEAALRTDQAALAVAEAEIRALTATAYQEWGAVLGKSLVDGSPQVTRLIERQDFLLQITVLPGASLANPPASAELEINKGSRTSITFVSPATRIDPKIQGVSYFYTAPAASGALPGMNVLAFLPTGKSVAGVTIPASAIVWWQDRAWVYRRSGPEAFTRTAIATDMPVAAGGYVVTDLPPDAEIVTRGAQMLLSEEFRSQIQVDED